MERSSWAISAVVEVTSVQPTSEKRTVRQLGGSRRPPAGGSEVSSIGATVLPRVAAMAGVAVPGVAAPGVAAVPSVAVAGMARAASAGTGSANTAMSA